MARRTYADVDGYVLERLGNRTDATTALRAQWINDALLRVANLYECPELHGEATETLSAGSGDLTLSGITDLWWPRLVRVDGTSPRIVEPDNFEHIVRGTRASGTPSRFAWYRGLFYFNTLAPTGGLTIRIYYHKKPTEWTTGNCVLPQEFDLQVELRAAAIGLEYFREFEKAATLRGLATNDAQEMKLPVIEARFNDYKAGLRPGGRRR
jgi:hypothetical protein